MRDGLRDALIGGMVTTVVGGIVLAVILRATGLDDQADKGERPKPPQAVSTEIGGDRGGTVIGGRSDPPAGAPRHGGEPGIAGSTNPVGGVESTTNPASAAPSVEAEPEPTPERTPQVQASRSPSVVYRMQPTSRDGRLADVVLTRAELDATHHFQIALEVTPNIDLALYVAGDNGNERRVGGWTANVGNVRCYGTYVPDLPFGGRNSDFTSRPPPLIPAGSTKPISTEMTCSGDWPAPGAGATITVALKAWTGVFGTDLNYAATQVGTLRP